MKIISKSTNKQENKQTRKEKKGFFFYKDLTNKNINEKPINKQKYLN
jgi:hypothetical protein